MRHLFIKSLLTALTVAVIIATGALFHGAKTIHDIMSESKELKAAIATLTQEEQIGYAKVIKQETREGKLFTTLRFVETARDDQLQTVLSKEVELEGDTAHFDALIVTFSNQAVIDGKERTLYLWRRIYGEHQAPANGTSLDENGEAPARYRDLLERLKIRERNLFWEAIRNLADNPEALSRHGVRAVYGNVVYKRLRPGLLYVFKISSTGRIFPETIPDL